MKTLLSNRNPPFYDFWEAETTSKKEDVIRHRLNEIVEFSVSKTNFYKKKFKDLSLNLRDAYPLKNFPTLKPEELRTGLPPVSHDLLSQLTHSYSVFQSGGSTGTPKTSLFTHEELEIINLCNARGFYATGLTNNDRVANLWAVGGLYMTFIHMNRVLQNYGCMSFPFSNHTPAEFIYHVSKMYNINCYTGITSTVLNTLRAIHQAHPNELKIEKIYFGGEPIYESDRNELQKNFGAQIISAPGYGTVDSWYIGYQCERCSNGVFHTFDDMVYVEILDEEGSHCEVEEIGDIYITVFHRKLTPIIRLKIGDRAKWVQSSCHCGRTSPLFQLFGRCDDILRIGYDSIDYDFIQKLTTRIAGLNGRLQLQKRRKEGKDLFKIRAESILSADRYPEQTHLLTSAFLKERLSFDEFVRKKTIWPLDVEILQAGSLPQNSRTGKLIKIDDLSQIEE
jgi:phenylacetate-CoA ligase